MNRTLFGSTANGMNSPMLPTRPMMPPQIGLPQRRPGSAVPRPGPAMRQPMGGLQAFGMAEGGSPEEFHRAWEDYQQPWQRDPESYRNKQLRTHGATVDEVAGWKKDPVGTGNLMRNMRDINSLVRDIAKRRGVRGFASGGRPDMGSIALRDAMLSMPNRAVPDYLLAGFADGGEVDEVMRAMRRRHGIGRGFSGIDREVPMRTMLQNDPLSHWDEEVPRQYNLWKWRRPHRGVEMSPDRANEITQNTLDNVHGPGIPRRIIEAILGDSPGSAALGFPGAKGMLPTPRASGLGALLYSGDAGAEGDEMLPRSYESHGQWQPFQRVEEPIR